MAMVLTALAQSAIEVEPTLPESLPAIDRDHLARMTFGDRSLEQEVLQLFDRQSTLLIARMRNGDGAAVGALAHTLKGSAAGIGAKAVARAAEAAEQAAVDAPADLSATIDRLALAIDEARALIADLLRAE
jgi:HPt (histidine-containing phosphotransfer) domain-containing protein